MLEVRCKKCGKSAYTRNGVTPDSELECDCCPEAHDHAGLGCRPVHITMLGPVDVTPRQ